MFLTNHHGLNSLGRGLPKKHFCQVILKSVQCFLTRFFMFFFFFNFQSVSPKDQSCEIWLKLAQWIRRCCLKILDGRTDGRRRRRTVSETKSDKTNGHFQNTNKSTKTKVDTRPPFTTRLTFIAGSCILKHVETKFLDENVRIKHFKNAKIDTLKDKLSKMDLAHYKQIVIHVGGHDADANISQNSFRNKYKQLLDDINKQNSKVFVSGLLPRERKNMKPFNDILKTLCKSMNIEFIDNHDSFILASGEFPFEFFHADKINVKFAGIRALIQNIHRKCLILPKPNNAVSDRYTNTTRHNVRTFVPTTHTSSRREQSHIGSRRRPIWVY